MARLGKVSKSPADVEKYTVDYSQWLETAETLTNATFTVTPTTVPPLSPGASTIDGTGKLLSVFVSGGLAGNTYKLVITVTTSAGQTKDDHLLFAVAAE